MKATSLLEGGNSATWKQSNMQSKQKILISTNVEPANKYSYSELYKGQLYLYYCYDTGAARQTFGLNVRVIKVSQRITKDTPWVSHTVLDLDPSLGGQRKHQVNDWIKEVLSPIDTADWDSDDDSDDAWRHEDGNLNPHGGDVVFSRDNQSLLSQSDNAVAGPSGIQQLAENVDSV